MIKLICFLKRNKKLSRDQFHDHWSNIHGGLFANNPDMRQYIARYEQNHRMAADYLRDPEDAPFEQQGYDGVTAIWYHSMDAFNAMNQDSYYRENVAADEKKLLENNTANWLLCDNTDVIFDKPQGRESATAKLLCMVRKNAALERSHFHKHWLEHHGGLFINEPDLNKDILVYDQNHRSEADYEMGPERNQDGVTEQWFESIERFYKSLKEPIQKTHVEPDVAYMLDPKGTHFIMSDLPEVIIA